MPNRRLGLALAVPALLSACYTLERFPGPVPEVGTDVAFDVNEQGRVALGGVLGPEIARVQGTLLEKQPESYLIAVRSVDLLRGGEQVWSGEQVRLRPEYLGTAYERRLSLGRSLALAVTGVGGVAAFVVTRSLTTGGTEEGDEDDDDGDLRIGRP